MKTVNDYKGITDNDRIEAAIADRDSQGGIVILPPRRSDIEPERDWWLLDRAILIPAHTTVILRHCKIKLSDRCRDNFFRSANCGIGIADVQRIHDIHIKGEGLCVLQGADHPRAAGDASKILSNPCPKLPEDLIRLADWIPEERKKSGKLDFWDEHRHSYGTDAGKPGEVQHGDWRGIGILFACADDFSIEGLRMVETHGWAISCEDCTHGRLEHIEFDSCMAKMIDGMLMNMENQDGIDIRNGCHDILINDITGGTGDDIVALTAIAARTKIVQEGELPDLPKTFRPSGSLDSTHILHNDWDKRDPDIRDIIIRNVKGYSKGRICLHIRLLAAEAVISNVIIDGVVDTSPEDVRASAVIQLGDGGGYGENWADSIRNIAISNVICNSRRAIHVGGYVTDSVITNIVNRNPNCACITVDKPNGLKNVAVSGLVSAGEKLIDQR